MFTKWIPPKPLVCLREFIQSQEPLGAEFAKVWDDNADALYEDSKAAIKKEKELETVKAENARLRELLELAYAWVPQTDKPLLSKIEAALKTEDDDE
jgi:hypothetical protein